VKFAVCALALFTLPLLAEDLPLPGDPDLPQPFDTTALAAVVHQSPFTRVVSFEDTYLLTGVAYVDGKPMATLLNKETKQRFVVTETPNAHGWKLVDAPPTTDPKHTRVTLEVGGEAFVLTYHEIIPTPTNPNGRGKREVTPVDIHRLTEAEYTRKDENGKLYVRGSVYLPTADRDFYYNKMPDAARDKFREIIRNERDLLFKYTPDQRASYVKKVFDKVNADSGGRR